MANAGVTATDTSAKLRAELPSDSVGLVAPQTAQFAEPLALESGRSLPNFELVYETYGELNAQRSNAVLICHALTGDHHAAGYHADRDNPGWWETCLGPGKPLDTNRFYFVCPNNLGGCKGSTGPLSINPENGKAYGPDFPIVTVKDWVNSQALLADRLGIEQWAAVVGGSLGGMAVLQWAIDYPARLRHAVIIAAAPKLSAQNIGFNEVARQAIRSDPEFRDGYYAEHDTKPVQGVSIARMLGHITYLSDASMGQKFGRELRNKTTLGFDFNVDFEVESYLRYQGRRFVDRFDANSYLLLTKMLDYFDPAREYGDDLAQALAQVQAKCLVISFTKDWRFSSARSREIVKALLDADKDVSYAEVDSRLGHDDFLMPIPQYLAVLNAYMQGVST